LDNQRQLKKQSLLEQLAHEEQNKLSKSMFLNHQTFSIEDSIQLKHDFNDIYGDNAWDICHGLNLSKYKKSKRIREKTKSIIQDDMAFFITITFRDEVLEKTSEKTRRVYVSRWLKSQSDTYVANIDYGAQKGREHYHAIIKAKSIKKTWQYGFIDLKKITPIWQSTKNLPLYLAKLSHHAIKLTTQNKRIIYSRKIV
jgi:hypothetical protein